MANLEAAASALALAAAFTPVVVVVVDKNAAAVGVPGSSSCAGVGRKQCAVRKDIADMNRTAPALVMVGTTSLTDRQTAAM